MPDLRNHLFEALERLSDDEKPLDEEIKRAKAICEVAQVLVNTAKVEVDLVAAVEGSRASEFFDAAEDRLLTGGENEQLARGFGKYGMHLREPRRKEIA